MDCVRAEHSWRFWGMHHTNAVIYFLSYIVTYLLTVSHLLRQHVSMVMFGILFCLRRYSCTIDQLLACRSKFVVHSFVSGSHTEAELSSVNILSECLMLRDNLLFLSVDFPRQDIVDLVSHLCVA